MPERRRFLAAAGSALPLSALAGCTGPRPEQLRFRNFTTETQTVTVRIWDATGEQVFEEMVDLDANFAGEQPEQPTRRGVFAQRGSYELTVFLDGGPTVTDSWDVDDTNLTYHVTVREGPELVTGRLGP